MRKYKQGIFKPQHPEKYEGDVNNIIYRSSYEYKFMQWVDLNKNCIQWSSEEVIIPYISPLDNKFHRYFIDFKLTIINKNQIKQTFLIEIKPKSQVKPPRNKKNKIQLMEELATYSINQAKWSAAKEYCKKHNYQFKIVTEDDLGIK